MQFKRCSFAEFEKDPEVLEPLRNAPRKGTITLLYSAHEEEHNQAIALRDFLMKRAKKASR